MKTELNYPEILDSIPSEQLETFLEERKDEMKRREILKKHPIKQLSNGHWYTRLDGKKIERTTKKSLEDAVVDFYSVENQNLVSIFDDYLSMRKMEVADTTWQKDIYYFNRYIKDSELGSIPFSKIKLKDGYAFLSYCKTIYPEMKRKYWSNINCMLTKMFVYAINEGYLERDPFVALSPKKDLFAPKTFTRDADTVFSRQEHARIIELAEEDAATTHLSAPYAIFVLFNTGMRVGELCALKWSDIETGVKGHYLHIQREMVRKVDDNGRQTDYRIVDHCKTESSDRRILINAKAMEVFDKIKHLNIENDLPVALDDYVFLRYDTKDDTIKNVNPRGIDARLKKYCKHAGMTVSKSAHDIRRTALTELYESGMPLKNVQSFAGHSSLKQTMEYIRLADNDIDEMQFINMLANPLEKETDTVIPFTKAL